MNKLVCYVGVDVGQEELWAALAEHKPRAFAHTPVGVRALCRWSRTIAGTEAVVHYCMEATGVYSRRLAVRLLVTPDTMVSIVNPAQIKAFAKAQLRRTKTDAVDARVILAFAISQTPLPWTPEPPAVRELAVLVGQADALRKTQRQWDNRHHAHTVAADAPALVRQTDRAMARTCQRRQARIEAEIDRVCAADPGLQQQVELLCTIPGVGPTTAVRLLAYGKTALVDRSVKALAAHAGLAPAHRQSGTSVRGKSHIAKHGDHRLRQVLYMPSLVAAVHNPLIRACYQRLLANGKPKMVALVACMRKLLHIIHGMLKHQTPFNPALHPMNT